MTLKGMATLSYWGVGIILLSVMKDIVSLRKGKLRKWGEGDRVELSDSTGLRHNHSDVK